MLELILLVTGREVISCVSKLDTHSKISVVLPLFFPLPGTSPWLANFLRFRDSLAFCLFANITEPSLDRNF